MLWAAATAIMLEARDLGAVIAFEWPTFCEYWTRDEVRAHMEEMEYRFLYIHGCMYGLRSIARATKGLPIKKPWTIATDCPNLRTCLNKRCQSH